MISKIVRAIITVITDKKKAFPLVSIRNHIRHEVGMTNNIRNQAEEIIRDELIYA